MSDFLTAAAVLCPMRRLLYPVLCLPVQSALCTTSRAAFSTCSSCAGQLSVSGSAALTPDPHLSSAALAEVQNWWEGSDWDSTALHQGKAVAFYLQSVIPRSDMDNVSNKCNFGLTDWGRFLMQKLVVGFGYSSCAQWFFCQKSFDQLILTVLKPIFPW